MARSRAQSKSKPEVHEEAEVAGGGVIDGNGSPALSKAQAVRNAIDEGLEELDDIENFVKSRYGLEIPRQMLSSYKSQIKSKMVSGKAVRGRKPRSVSEAAPARRSSKGDEAGLLEALEALKPLVASLGGDKVKRLVDLLG